MPKEHDIRILNKRASYEYFLGERMIAGIQLTGTEIKSIRARNASLKEAYCLFKGNELYIRSMHIAQYKEGAHNNHEELRDRKLLLKKLELRKLKRKVEEKGNTIVPTELFVDERGLAKMEIAIASGKKAHDKRHSIKEKDIKREMDRQRRF